MKTPIILFIFLSCCAFVSLGFQFKWWEWNSGKWWNRPNARNQHKRFLDLMKMYHDDDNQKVYELNDLKHMHIESPYFEMGYVMGEIVERYRKMVANVRRGIEFLSDTVFDTLLSTEICQRLYFEIYHLVNMFHEVPAKYKHVKEFSNIMEAAAGKPAPMPTERALTQAEYDRQRRLQAKQRKRGYKKLREEALQTPMSQSELKELLLGGHRKPVDKSISPNAWPVLYGWHPLHPDGANYKMVGGKKK